MIVQVKSMLKLVPFYIRDLSKEYPTLGQKNKVTVPGPKHVGPVWLHTLSPAVLLSLEAFLGGLFWNGVQLRSHILYDVLEAVNAITHVRKRPFYHFTQFPLPLLAVGENIVGYFWTDHMT
jgi:hypothetical protein